MIIVSVPLSATVTLSSVFKRAFGHSVWLQPVSACVCVCVLLLWSTDTGDERQTRRINKADPHRRLAIARVTVGVSNVLPNVYQILHTLFGTVTGRGAYSSRVLPSFCTAITRRSVQSAVKYAFATLGLLAPGNGTGSTRNTPLLSCPNGRRAQKTKGLCQCVSMYRKKGFRSLRSPVAAAWNGV